MMFRIRWRTTTRFLWGKFMETHSVNGRQAARSTENFIGSTSRPTLSALRTSQNGVLWPRGLCTTLNNHATNPGNSLIKATSVANASNMSNLLAALNKTKPVEGEIAPKPQQSIIQKGVAMAKLFYHGSVSLGRNFRSMRKLQQECKAGRPLSYASSVFIAQTKEDIRRLRLFLFLSIVLPESIPFVISFMPSLLPSTYEEKEQAEARMITQEGKLLAQASLCYASFMKTSSTSVSAARHELIAKITGDTKTDAFEVVRMFLDHVASTNNVQLRSIADFPRPALELLCIAFHQPTFGTSYFMRRRINQHLKQVAAMDIHLDDALNTLTHAELETACRLRGMCGTQAFDSPDRLRAVLRLWSDHASTPVNADDRQVAMAVFAIANVFSSLSENGTVLSLVRAFKDTSRRAQSLE